MLDIGKVGYEIVHKVFCFSVHKWISLDHFRCSRLTWKCLPTLTNIYDTNKRNEWHLKQPKQVRGTKDHHPQRQINYEADRFHIACALGRLSLGRILRMTPSMLTPAYGTTGSKRHIECVLQSIWTFVSCGLPRRHNWSHFVGWWNCA